MQLHRARILWSLAWINIGTHVLGLALALVGIRPGSPLVTLEERLSYLSTAPALWTIGWGVWMACALALLAFLAALLGCLPKSSVAGTLALVLAGAGVAVDLVCETVHITVMPGLASSSPLTTDLFLAFERALVASGAIVANGLYAIAVLLVTRCLARHANGARYIPYLGYGTFLCGMLMVAAGFASDPRYLELVTGPTIGIFCGWCFAVTRHLTRREPQL